MKLTRISKIKKFRLFRDFSWPKQRIKDFGRYNLIFGLNGTGKSTLAALFRHLQDNTAIETGEAVFEIDGGLVKGGEIPNKVLPPVRVFNRDYVNESLSSVGDIEPIYILGTENVHRQREIEQLKNQFASGGIQLDKVMKQMKSFEHKLDNLCTTQARIIKKTLAGFNGNKYINYDQRDFKNTAEFLRNHSELRFTMSEDQQKNLYSQKNAKLKQTINILSLPIIGLDDLMRDVVATVGRSLVAQALDELASSPKLAAWVQEGLKLHSGPDFSDNCRFCLNQFNNARRSELAAHFNDSFTSFQFELGELISKLNSAKTIINEMILPDQARFYEMLEKEARTANDLLSSAQSELEITIQKLIELVETKRNNPLAHTTTNFLHSNLSASLSEAIHNFNAVIDRHNTISADLNQSVEDACNKLEYAIVSDVYEDYNLYLTNQSIAKTEVADIKAKQETLQTKINMLESELSGHHQAADELTKEIRYYLGHDELKFEEKEYGYALIRGGEPASNLSEGERASIAFLYFLKHLKDKSFDLNNGIVVIDDPVSSLDANALYSAFSYMKERTNDAGQLFILTHNFSLFRQVKKNWFDHCLGPKEQKRRQNYSSYYQLKTSIHEDQRHSSLEPLDPMLRKYDSEYHYLFKKVWENSRVNNVGDSNESYYELPNVARRLLEAFFSFHFPDRKKELYGLIKDVSVEGVKQERIYRFVNAYSHHWHVAEPNHDLSILSETPDVLTDVLDLIQAADPVHFLGMTKLAAEAQEENSG